MLTVLSISVLLVVTCVGIHYAALVRLSQLPTRKSVHRRRGLNLLVLGALVAHVAEAYCFAVGYFALDALGEGYGFLSDAAGERSEDYWYFSLVAYTSLGFGDITPHGPLRFMTALETLTGLILIAWTASFIFLEMQATWDHKQTTEGDPS